jgi:hypothetical protein
MKWSTIARRVQRSDETVDDGPDRRGQEWSDDGDSGQNVAVDQYEPVSAGPDRLAIMQEAVDDTKADVHQLRAVLDPLRPQVGRVVDDLAVLQKRVTEDAANAETASAWNRALMGRAGFAGVAPGMSPEEWALVAASNRRLEEPEIPLSALTSFLAEFGMAVVRVSCESTSSGRLRLQPTSNFHDGLSWFYCSLDAQAVAYLVPLSLSGIVEDEIKAMSLAFRGAERAATSSGSSAGRVMRACRMSCTSDADGIYEILQPGALAQPQADDAGATRPPTWTAGASPASTSTVAPREPTTPVVAEYAAPAPVLVVPDASRLAPIEDRLAILEAGVFDRQPADEALLQRIATLEAVAAALQREPSGDTAGTFIQEMRPLLDYQAATLHDLQARMAPTEQGLASIEMRLQSVESAFVVIEARMASMFASFEAMRGELAAPRVMVAPPAVRSEPVAQPLPTLQATPQPTLPVMDRQPEVTPGAAGMAVADPECPSLPLGWQAVMARCGSVSNLGPSHADEEAAYLHRLELLCAGLTGLAGTGPDAYRVRLAHVYVKKGNTILLHPMAETPEPGPRLSCRDCGDLSSLAFQVFVAVERPGRPEVAVLLPCANYYFSRFARGVQMLVDGAHDSMALVSAIREPAILVSGGQSEYSVRRKMSIISAAADSAR